ncbi:MAG: carbohydrate-binding protein, partial [Flavobacteriaceae bacterium]|nr:carbohydrate-binding protein [Flavobacteriaceae bacterium]
YTVNIAEAGVYKADVRLAALSSGGKFHIQINNQEVTLIQNVSSTGGWNTFSTHTINDLILPSGQHILKFNIDGDSEFNYSSIKFTKTGETTSIPLKVLNGHTVDFNSLEIVLNQPISQTSLATSKDFLKLIINGVEETISSVSFNPAKNRSLKLTTTKTLIFTHDIKVSYTGNVIKSVDDKTLETFTNLAIRNTLESLFVIPGKVEAENYVEMVGLGIENTTDIGEGSNIGYTSTNDYANYKIYAENTGNYKVKFRVAAQNSGGKIGLFLLVNGVENQLLTVNIPQTGGWQTWTTVEANANIPQGIHTIRMKVLSPEFNLNWMEFSLLTGNDDSDGDGIKDSDDACPNTAPGATVDTTGCTIFSLPSNNFSIQTQGETCPDRKNGKLIISAIKNHNYKFTLNGIVRNFNVGITLSGLSPGTYNFCISVEGQVFEQCFKVEVAEGKVIMGSSRLAGKVATINIKQGTAPFTAYINGQKVMETSSNEFNLSINNGDLIEVKTALECEGVLENRIEILNVIAFPNPSKGKFEISIPTNKREIPISIFNIFGQLISHKNYDVLNGKVNIDISKQSNGIYFVNIHQSNPIQLKLIKE